MPLLSAKEKLQAVLEVVNNSQTISRVAAGYGVTRQTLGVWVGRYRATIDNSQLTINRKGKLDSSRSSGIAKRSNVKGQLSVVKAFVSGHRRGANHPRHTSWMVEKLILDLVVRHPTLSIYSLKHELANKGSPRRFSLKGHGISTTGVYQVLLRHGLQTRELRRRFSLEYPARTVFASSLPVHLRAKLIDEYLKEGKKISDLCRIWHVSRQTFYAWLRRYQESGVQDALAKRYKRGVFSHKSTVSQETREKVLAIVRANPMLSCHKLYRELPKVAGVPIVTHQALQNLLKREGLNLFSARLNFAARFARQVAAVAPLYVPEVPLWRLRMILSPFVTVPKLLFTNPRAAFPSFLLLIAPLPVLAFFIKIIFSSASGSPVGLFFASISLIFGLFFFIYSMKYYITILMVLRLASSSARASENKQSKVSPLNIDLSKIELSGHPFVSIHVALYNEKRVVERLIKACTGQEWYKDANSPISQLASGEIAKGQAANYEIVIADDSTDQTTEIAKGVLVEGLGYREARTYYDDELEIYQFVPGSSHLPTVKLIHRFSRSGFKGAALQKALEQTDERAQYVAVFDADFVPYPDTLAQFIKSFQETCGGLEKVKESNVAAVQGYQWHVLNKSQNWVTRGVRTEYAGSYVIERSGAEIYGGLKQIAGSVYCIRADVLRSFGWGRSITEDFELTLRLYERGFKVVFTPYIQAPAEAVSTIKKLIRQRMRWAEGASFNIKVMFGRMLKSPHLTRVEKAEFLYLAPYYLQSAFFVIGTFAWFVSEAVLSSHLPFWTAALGWSLVFTNLLALPLMNVIGLFLEESDERDYTGVLSFIAFSYIVVPFQAYAAVKGFLEPSEGPWFRTPKTGRVTDTFERSGFGKFFGNIFRKPATVGTINNLPLDARGEQLTSDNLALVSAYNNFKSGVASASSSRRGWSWTAKTVMVLLLVFTTTLFYFSHGLPVAEATNMAGPLKLDIGAGDQSFPSWGNQLDNSQDYDSSSSLWPVGNAFANISSNNIFWLTNLLPTGVPDAVIPGGNYYVQFAKQGNGTVGGTTGTNVLIQLYLTSQDGTGRTILQSNSFFMRQNNADNTLMQFSIGNLVGNNITSAARNRLGFWMMYINSAGGNPNCRTNANCYWNIAINNTNLPARLIIPNGGITVPEIAKPLVMAILLVIMPVMPAVVSGRYRKKGRSVIEEFGMAWKDMIKKLLGSDAALDELPV